MTDYSIVLYFVPQLETNIKAAAEKVANITSNTLEVDVLTVSVAGNIVENLTEAAIEDEQVGLVVDYFV